MDMNSKCHNCYHNKDNPKICLPFFFFLECRYKRKNKKRKQTEELTKTK